MMIKASGKGEVVGFERGKNGETLSKESPDEVGRTYSRRHIGHDNASPPEMPQGGGAVMSNPNEKCELTSWRFIQHYANLAHKDRYKRSPLTWNDIFKIISTMREAGR